MTQFCAKDILLELQRQQQRHDEVSHRDILSFDLQKRLKHMVLHFYKYAGKLEAARERRDQVALRHILLDTFIICMASANAMNLSLGEGFPIRCEDATLDALAHQLAKDRESEDVFSEVIRHLVLIGGRMAKAVESADHMEDGNPRAEMAVLVAELTGEVLAALGRLETGLDADLRSRLQAVEEKSIFFR